MGQLIVLDGCTFFISEETGDTNSNAHEGFFSEDVRHLSRWELLVDGKPIDVLTSERVDYFSARIVGGTRNDKPIAIRRDRFVTDGFHEDVELENLSEEPRRVRIEFRFDSDFADVMEAQQGVNDRKGRNETRLGKRSITLAENRRGYRRGTKITFRKQGRLRKDGMRFDLELGPREKWKTCIDVVPVIDGEARPSLLGCNSFNKPVPKMELSLDEWMESAPTLDTDDDGLKRTYQAVDRRPGRPQASSERELRVGAARRWRALVHDRLRTRQHPRVVPGPAVSPDPRRNDPGCARGDPGGRFRPLRGRRAGQDLARAPAWGSGANG